MAKVRKQEMKNLLLNIKPVMNKCKHGKHLTQNEQETIVQFHLEVISYTLEN